MASEYRRRTVLTWSVLGAGAYGLRRVLGPPATPDEERQLFAGRGWHAQPICAFAVSPDGKYFATGSRPLSDSSFDESEGVVCWRVSDGQPRWRRGLQRGVEKANGAFAPLVFAPDGSLLGVFTRSNILVSIEVPGSAPVGSQDAWQVDRTRPFFFSQDGLRLFLPVRREAGELGQVVPSRDGLSIARWAPRFGEADAMPFRLDDQGLHVVAGTRYLILPPEGSLRKVADVVRQPAVSVVTTPSRHRAAALTADGSVGVIDVGSGATRSTLGSPVNAVMLARTSGVPLGLQRQPPVWHAYSLGAEGTRPVFSGKEADDEPIAGALPVAIAPEGNTAVSIDGDGELTWWETYNGKEITGLGRFKGACGVVFPADDHVVVFGPTMLAFVDLVKKRTVARYRFPAA